VSSSVERTPKAKQELLAALQAKSGGFIAQFFVAHGLGQAYELPGPYDSKAAKIASTMTEAQRVGKEDEVYEALELMMQQGDIRRRRSGDDRAARDEVTTTAPAPRTSELQGMTAPADQDDPTSAAPASDSFSTRMAKSGHDREISPRRRRLWTNYGATPIGDAIELIDRRADQLGKWLVRAAEAGIFLIVAAVILAAAGVPTTPPSFVRHPAVATLAAVLGLLQLADWFWAKAPIGFYRSAVEWLRQRIVSVARRRAVTKLLTFPGVEEMAGRHLAADRASEFSVAAQTRRRRRRRNGARVVVLVMGVVIGGYTIRQSNLDRTYRLGDEFTLSRDFAVTVKSEPNCQDGRAGATPGSIDAERTCGIMVHFRNTSGMKLDACPPYFGEIGSDGPNYYVPGSNGMYSYDYATAVRTTSGLYRFETANPSSEACYPGKSVDSTFIYDVPQDVAPGDIRDILFSVQGKSGMISVALK
jgi:hypothetical protein